MWRLDNIILKNQWVIVEIKGGKKVETNESRNRAYQYLWDGCSKSCSKQEVHGDTCLPQETNKKSQVSNPTRHVKKLEKEQRPKLMEGNNKDKSKNK